MISDCVGVKRTGTFIVAFLIIDFALASVTLTDYIRLARDGGVARCSLPHIGRGIADRSIRDHHARSQAAPPQRVLTILPPVTALAVGLPAQRAIAQRFRALAQSGRGAYSPIRSRLTQMQS